MYIHASIRDCDFCGERYAAPIQAYAILAPGATGRWCEVLNCCDECLPDGVKTKC